MRANLRKSAVACGLAAVALHVACVAGTSAGGEGEASGGGAASGPGDEGASGHVKSEPTVATEPEASLPATWEGGTGDACPEGLFCAPGVMLPPGTVACPGIDAVSVNPAELSWGQSSAISVQTVDSPSPSSQFVTSVQWTTTAGTFADAGAQVTAIGEDTFDETFACGDFVGTATFNVTLIVKGPDGDGGFYLPCQGAPFETLSVDVVCEGPDGGAQAGPDASNDATPDAGPELD